MALPVDSVKIVIVGDGSVGKTCMLHSYAKNEFPKDYIPTVFDNYDATVEVGGRRLKVEIWDTAGQEDYERLRALSYYESDVFILCYSVVSKASFENVLNKWALEIQDWCPKASIVLCGTKMDLRSDHATMEKLRARGQYPISVLQGQRMATKIAAVAHKECSALTRENVKDVFDAAIAAALSNPQKKAPVATSAPSPGCCAIA
eukprot:Plantae.Rhodophyta-Rhodochaete_pulchella.ctg34921.p1 GENE.Plantae.Rhodophyta-Rhodochaete_pulchella.ctg34921~~Plantae.Rhodophyta-Rhodochaete_pulchella.ctg34921.p1  ORF type:complete len:204 (-),score=36.56 Plantae.Rhodophyta-Rhodochaete_pulchella.ctg34921:337-948(-)